ncbi:MAG: class I SAM-dependent methyltransferase [Bauldia sp.]
MSKGTIGLDGALNDYLVRHQPPEHPVLREIREATLKVGNAGLQIAPEQGHFLAFLAKLAGARNALEVGTFTGYSALAVMLAMPPDGTLTACDVSKEWTDVARRFWAKAGVADRIALRLGHAADTLAALEKEGAPGRFDFAFIDANKTGYDGYYESALRLVRPGGVIVVDNVLWGGAVADAKARDADTSAVRALNKKIAADERVDRVLVPVGDGMMVVRRR